MSSSSESATNELYSSVTPEVREELSKIARAVTLPRGTKLVLSGVKPKQLIILNSGVVRVEVPSEGKTLMLGLAGPGKVLALRAIVAGEPSEVEVTALEDCNVTLLESAEFLSILRRNPRMYLGVAKVLSADLLSADRFLRQRAGTTPTGR
jgi:CRP/FNR family transcriptional regulator, cyclic AMP receptor protein